MASQPLFKTGKPGAIVFYRQQDTEKAKPYTSCRIVALMMQLEFAGITFPDPTRFLETFRKGTGVAEVGSDGKTQGTSAGDIVDTAGVMMPWVPVVFGGWSEEALWEALRRGDLTITVAVSYPVLPASLRKFSPSFKGRHAIVLNGARESKGVRQYRWVDCLGPKGWAGKWVTKGTVVNALKASGTMVSGLIYGTTIAEGAGVSTFVRPSRIGPFVVRVPKGIDAWVEGPATGTLVRAKPVTKAQTCEVMVALQVTNYPQRAPSGGMIVIPTGSDGGKYVRQSAVTLTTKPGDPDCDARIAQATAPLQAELDDRASAMTSAIAELTRSLGS